MYSHAPCDPFMLTRPVGLTSEIRYAVVIEGGTSPPALAARTDCCHCVRRESFSGTGGVSGSAAVIKAGTRRAALGWLVCSIPARSTNGSEKAGVIGASCG